MRIWYKYIILIEGLASYLEQALRVKTRNIEWHSKIELQLPYGAKRQRLAAAESV